MQSDTLLAQALRFALVGIANTAAGLGAIILFRFAFGFGDLAANMIGYSLGIIISYVGNRSFSFRDRSPVGRALPRFLAAAAASYLLNLLVLFVMLTHVQAGSLMAQVAAVGTYSVCFFALSKIWVFPRRPSDVAT